MRLPTWNYEWLIGGWKAGIIICPGVWSVGVYRENDPVGIFLSLPLLMLSVERRREHQGTGWDCCWFLLRLLIGKQELRLELDLHGWPIGVKIFETNDWSIHLGPLDIECEYGKLY